MDVLHGTVIDLNVFDGTFWQLLSVASPEILNGSFRLGSTILAEYKLDPEIVMEGGLQADVGMVQGKRQRNRSHVMRAIHHVHGQGSKKKELLPTQHHQRVDGSMKYVVHASPNSSFGGPYQKAHTHSAPSPLARAKWIYNGNGNAISLQNVTNIKNIMSVPH